jgi:hypothetical protein
VETTPLPNEELENDDKPQTKYVEDEWDNINGDLILFI